jgi:hypothetical protein
VRQSYTPLPARQSDECYPIDIHGVLSESREESANSGDWGEESEDGFIQEQISELNLEEEEIGFCDRILWVR